MPRYDLNIAIFDTIRYIVPSLLHCLSHHNFIIPHKFIKVDTMYRPLSYERPGISWHQLSTVSLSRSHTGALTGHTDSFSFPFPFRVTVDTQWLVWQPTVSAEAQLLRHGPLLSPNVCSNCLFINGAWRWTIQDRWVLCIERPCAVYLNCSVAVSFSGC